MNGTHSYLKMRQMIRCIKQETNGPLRSPELKQGKRAQCPGGYFFSTEHNDLVEVHPIIIAAKLFWNQPLFFDAAAQVMVNQGFISLTNLVGPVTSLLHTKVYQWGEEFKILLPYRHENHLGHSLVVTYRPIKLSIFMKFHESVPNPYRIIAQTQNFTKGRWFKK